MRAGRLIDMLLILQRHGRVSARQLAAVLEVSPRTVLRDVDALSHAGVPIFTVQGVGGGIELLSGFRTELTGITTNEAAALLLAGQPAIAERLGMASGASAVRRKLIEALPGELGDAAEAIDKWFINDVEPWGGTAIAHATLHKLSGAIRAAVHVELTLASGQPVVVRPLGLVLKAGEWHLVEWSEPTATVRNVRDVDAVRITRRHFERPPGFDLATFWRDHCVARQLQPT